MLPPSLDIAFFSSVVGLSERSPLQPFATSASRFGEFPHEIEGFIDHNRAKDNEK